ncbi:MAG: M23 family metallopeptidase [Microthrixaceae bacterium]
MRAEPGKVVHPPPRFLRLLAVAVAVAVATIVSGPTSRAQVPGDSTTSTAPASSASSTTSATAPEATTTTTAGSGQPSGDQFAERSSAAPTGAQDSGGDGAAAPAEGIVVPPEAQRIINSVKRSRSNSSAKLLALMPQLQAFGVSEAEAFRIGFGRFPIAGPATFSHDWLFPRYGPGFRFHLGTDVFAPLGTPVRAPVDGVAISEEGGLGGLTVKVVMPDRTYFYLAHLSGLVEGFVNGMPVATGDIVGYVGDSGNARGGSPHLHLGIYPRGGAPIDPKPILDHFLIEAEERIPEVVAALQAVQPAPLEPAPLPRDARPMFATDALRPLARGGARLPAELVYLVGANPVDGPRALVDLALGDLIAQISWYAG